MFDRDKKNTDTTDTPETFDSRADTSRASRNSDARKRIGEVAIIGSSIQIKGDLFGDEDLRIEGNVSGTVRLKSNALTIGKSGKIKAGIYAKSITVDGETSGDLHASECVSIHANARVQGNIVAPRVSIVEGAHFKGSIEMDQEAVEKALGSMAKSAQPKSASRNEATAAAEKPPARPGAVASTQAKSA